MSTQEPHTVYTTKTCIITFLTGRTIDLSTYSAHDISSVLKRFLQQLANPLFTYDQYDRFMQISRAHESKKNEMQTLTDLCDVVKKLPQSHKATLNVLLKHLHTVSMYSEENKMTVRTSVL